MGASKYNPIFEFDCKVLSQNDQMVVSSIAGHMMNLDFPENYKYISGFCKKRSNWNTVDPIELFTAPVEKSVRADMKAVYSEIYFRL